MTGHHYINPGCKNNNGKGFTSSGTLHNHIFSKQSRYEFMIYQFILTTLTAPTIPTTQTGKNIKETGEIILWKGNPLYLK